MSVNNNLPQGEGYPVSLTDRLVWNTTNTTSHGGSVRWWGHVCIVMITITTSSAVTGTYRSFDIASGAPIPLFNNVSNLGNAVNIDGQKAEGWIDVTADGTIRLNVRNTAMNNKVINGSLVYFTEKSCPNG